MNNEYKLLCKRFQGLMINPANIVSIMLRMTANKVTNVVIPDGARLVRFTTASNNATKAFAFNFGSVANTTQTLDGDGATIFTNQRYVGSPVKNGRLNSGWYSCLGRQSVSIMNGDASVKFIGLEFVI